MTKTAVLTIPQQTYPPQTITFSPTLPAGTHQVIAELTLVNWPLGAVLTVEILYPDGTSAGSAGFSGNGTNNNGRGGNTVDITIGDGRDLLPVGNYTVKATILQTFSTAVTVSMT